MRDSDVVVAVGTTEDAAVRALFDQHAAPLMSYALRLTAGDRGRAEDVVQETLLRAWRHPEALDEPRGPARGGGGVRVGLWFSRAPRTAAGAAPGPRRARPSEVGDDALALVPAGDEIE